MYHKLGLWQMRQQGSCTSCVVYVDVSNHHVVNVVVFYAYFLKPRKQIRHRASRPSFDYSGCFFPLQHVGGYELLQADGFQVYD